MSTLSIAFRAEPRDRFIIQIESKMNQPKYSDFTLVCVETAKTLNLYFPQCNLLTYIVRPSLIGGCLCLANLTFLCCNAGFLFGDWCLQFQAEMTQLISPASN